MSEQRIWKYSLEVRDTQSFMLPVGTRILSIQEQNGQPCLWALVEPGMAVEQRTFLTFGTGHPGVRGDYIGTYQLHGGELVFHVFEEQVTPL